MSAGSNKWLIAAWYVAPYLAAGLVLLGWITDTVWMLSVAVWVAALWLFNL